MHSLICTMVFFYLLKKTGLLILSFHLHMVYISLLLLFISVKGLFLIRKWWSIFIRFTLKQSISGDHRLSLSFGTLSLTGSILFTKLSSSSRLMKKESGLTLAAIQLRLFLMFYSNPLYLQTGTMITLECLMILGEYNLMFTMVFCMSIVRFLSTLGSNQWFQNRI